MKATELRIGNWVQIAENILDDQKPGHEFQWQLMNFYSLEKGYCNEDCFEPIPLTEEWLLKFGIQKDYTNKMWLDLEIEAGKYCFGYCNYQEEFMRICKCEYVHQLQNLYFALTGEELILT